MTHKNHFDIVVSINVHEKPSYLMHQLDNIASNLKMNNIVLVNSNEYMSEIIGRFCSCSFLLNPNPVEKRRYHGSLTEGIVSNMRMAVEKFEFDWFLVMSSRDFFYRKLERAEQIKETEPQYKSNDYSKNDWHWPVFRNTELYRYIQSRGMYYSSSPHEGLCLDSESVQNVLLFLSEHKEIEEDIYNFEGCVEEFAIQSICANFKGYHCISNGVWELSDKDLNPKQFTRKMPR